MYTSAFNFLSYERAIAAYLKQGFNVRLSEGFVTFDDRMLQRECVRGFEGAKDVLVLGSSTALQLRQKHFPGRSFFNHALRRGVLEDTFAVYQLHRAVNLEPKLVVIGVDGWIFDPSHWKSYWPVLHNEFFRLTSDWEIALRAGQRRRVAARRILDLALTPTGKAFWRSLRALTSRSSRNPKFAPTHDDFTDDYTKRIDGSVGYHTGFRDRSTQAVVDTIAASVQFPKYSISTNYQHALETFVVRLLEQGVQVAFFIPPHHPAVFRLRTGNVHGNAVLGWSDYVANLIRVEEYIRDVLGVRGAKVFGSFSPEPFQARDDEFYDWMHPKESLVERLLESVA